MKEKKFYGRLSKQRKQRLIKREEGRLEQWFGAGENEDLSYRKRKIQKEEI